MKIKKYGYSEFRESTELLFAVMVDVAIPSEEKNGDGYPKSYTHRMEFVTSINMMDKTWKAENGKEAYYFRDRKSAQDFCIALAWNWTAGYVVECLDTMHLQNNW